MKNNIQKKLQEVKNASLSLIGISIKDRNKIISDISKKLLEMSEKIILENKKDLEKIDSNNPMYDRLLLDKSRIESMANWCKKLIKIKDPLDKYSRDNSWIISTETDWLKIKKQAVPLWVVSCIYEARPNVTIDIAIMCIKSWNAMILRGGSKAENSNNILIKIIKEVLVENKIDENIIYNFPLKRENLEILYNATGLVDVIIPRWLRDLIDSVKKKSLIPIIETWAGVVNLYLDSEIEKQNFEKAINVIINAKTSRPSVCNALDTLIINKNLWENFIENLFKKLEKLWVNIFKNEKNIDFFKEQLSLNLNIKFVETLDEAIKHIQTYSTKHSDWILSDNLKNIEKFKKIIDSSVVYVNTSTRFSDWEYFWFGWEIWISTQKLHARWPMWAEVLVSYKYIIDSEWRVR